MKAGGAVSDMVFRLLLYEQMEKDIPGAVKYIKQSQGHAKAVGFREGVREAGDALYRLALKRSGR